MPQAATAITILKELLERTDAAHLAYWVTPNVVLTLAGARGYCDGIFWGEPAQIARWQREIDEDVAILQAIADVYMAKSGIETVGDDVYASFDMVLRPGLQYALRQTKLLSVDPDDIATRTPEKIMESLQGSITKALSKKYDQESLSHIAFGVLLGYPDAAIMGMTNVWNTTQPGPFDEPTVPADIRGAAYYICPQPVYDYPRHLVHDKTIIAHEQAWSDILRDFYTSDFHVSLADDPIFRRRIAELEML